ncbi:MAG: TonB-dependent receptor, partial [Novosphingobium sp.]|nr:TonB-dependent receptor [Novosphingobium sp.]
DVGQIEVLKGPQSLFFGKSSPGGVISLRTADPTDEFEMIVRAGYEFEARERRADFIVSGPLSDGVKVRLASTIGKQDGFFYNNAVGNPAYGSLSPTTKRMTPAKDYKIRGTLLLDPSDDFSARIKVNHVYDKTNWAGTGQNVFCPDGTSSPNGIDFIDPDCKFDRHTPLVRLDPAAFPTELVIANDGVPFNRTKQTYGTMELNYDLSEGLTLTSATGYYNARSRSFLNASMASAAAGLISAENHFQRRQFTEEVRLTSDFDSPLNFLIGAYIERGKFSDRVTIGANQALSPAFPDVLQYGKKTVRIETTSLFGQVLYKVVPEVEITAGVRWTDETRRHKGVNFISGTPVPVNTAVDAINAKNFAPEVTVTYRPNDDLTLFAALKQGYKSGSFNVSTPPFTGEDNSFGDEKVQGGEIGLKSRLMDRSMTFNVAAYYYKFTGLQVGANVQADNGITVTRTVNAGKARIYGIEAEVAYSPPSVDGLNLRAAFNWNDNKYTKLNNIPCYGGQTVSAGCNLLFNPAANGGTGGYTSQDRSGVPLIRAPKWSGIFGFDYEMPVGDNMTLTFANNNQVSSKYLTNLGRLWYQDGFIKTDASLTLRGGSEREWEFALIGKNLNNKITTGNCANSNRAGGTSYLQQITGRGEDVGVGGTDEIGCYTDRGRELWVRFSLTFR